MTSLTHKPRMLVVTHTAGLRPEWMALCQESVKPRLPEDAAHVAIHLNGHDKFAAARLSAFSLAEFIAFVDDDDLMTGDPVRKCLAALDANPTAGLAFTNEELIDKDGNVMRAPSRMKEPKYSDFLVGPSNIAHHLCVFRTSMVDVEGLSKIASNAANAVEWLMAASTAFVHGAVHVPEVGYQWRQHQEGMHTQPQHRTEFATKQLVYRSYLGSIPNKKTGPIPIFR